MSRDDLKSGVVIRYPYLWARESDAGETEGRKHRPTVAGFRVPTEGGDILLLPVTTKEPEPSRLAFEIPPIEKRRAGLDADLRLWLILDEFNADPIEGSYCLEPEPPLGRFSRAFFLPLMRKFVARRERARSVRRGD